MSPSRTWASSRSTALPDRPLAHAGPVAGVSTVERELDLPAGIS
ncbi:hypothetical protein [Saccharothrix variisporea]|uniref:Uncharacterized protein n=1 Tax=Saccharothrix variisporea TaxID=543527 RepID=A0A495XBW8_9PSEU|nr:hypothetical protein [Saccharothrix variisporea]RKT69018.1 hypothetical protein DFJ66_2211 [Saccharothrix variisporea]